MGFHKGIGTSPKTPLYMEVLRGEVRVVAQVTQEVEVPLEGDQANYTGGKVEQTSEDGRHIGETLVRRSKFW